jgi:hypothetical protein
MILRAFSFPFARLGEDMISIRFIMKPLVLLVIFSCSLLTSSVNGQAFRKKFKSLAQSSCIQCHDADTETGLNLDAIGHDLSDAETFRQWEKIFDRVTGGEMPPESEERPNPKQLKTALGSLGKDLRATSLARQEQFGRVPARRLTKLEYGYTIRDLLLIDSDVTSEIPNEVESGSFDTVGSAQRISAVHMESYLKAADQSLDRALVLSRNPYVRRELDFINNRFLNEFHDKPLSLGGNISRRLEDGVALFRDVDYLLNSGIAGFQVPTPGIYRITSKVAAFQSREPVTFKLILKEPSGGAKLLTAHDLVPGKTETVKVTAYMKPGDIFYTTFEMKAEPFAAIAAAGGSKNYKGPGIAIKGQRVEGPLSENWPPQSTTSLLDGLELKEKPAPSGLGAYLRNRDPRYRNQPAYSVLLDRPPIEHVSEVVEQFAPRAFRRPLLEGELESFVSLAEPAIEEGRGFVDALRVSLRSMLSSPQFILFGGQPGELDDHALASRLSYFLWKSMPDEQLFSLASEGRLSDPEVLAGQVERMLADEKSNRFVRDFLGQWLLLYKINATMPDEKLYPEYDELLGQAVPREPELFFTELIEKNLGLGNLVDSDFTFLNRRLAEHYGIAGITGQQFRRVDLPEESPRGGILTQAAVLKVTANGTVTSPVTRGNFVLTSILGTPPLPPPPTVGSIEPDTRGQTTIREILAAHRDTDTCNKCHREIDPPGFALESFDPIGGFRTRYRANASGRSSFFSGGKTYKDGPAVDASGVTADGKEFSGIREFKQHLLNEKEQIARHFISQLVVFSTGGEIQFADREEVEAILERTRDAGFPVRTIIHEVVQSRLFRIK